MKKFIAILVLLAFASPVRAGLITDFDPVEKNLVDKQQPAGKQQLEEDMSREFKKQPVEPIKSEPDKVEAKTGSNWWKWTLGIVLIGGIAAAAGGGGGGGGGGGSTTNSGGSTVTGSW